MNLHNQIMNLSARPIAADQYDHKLHAYKCGHRDARHDAAELSLKYERYREYLEDMFLESVGAMLCGNLTRESGMGKEMLDRMRASHGL
jgi:hypothetical protein